MDNMYVDTPYGHSFSIPTHCTYMPSNSKENASLYGYSAGPFPSSPGDFNSTVNYSNLENQPIPPKSDSDMMYGYNYIPPTPEEYSQPPTIDSEDYHTNLELLTTDLMERVIRQVEYWLSDENLKNDEFIVKRMSKGWVQIKLLATMKKMKRLTKDTYFIADALRNSEKLIVSDDDTKVCRKVPFCLEEALSAELRTVMAKNLPEDVQLDELNDLFSECGEIEHSNIVLPRANVSSKKNVDEAEKPKSPYAFIRYIELESAISACTVFSDECGWRGGIHVSLQSGLNAEQSRERYEELLQKMLMDDNLAAQGSELTRSNSSEQDSESDVDSKKKAFSRPGNLRVSTTDTLPSQDFRNYPDSGRSSSKSKPQRQRLNSNYSNKSLSSSRGASPERSGRSGRWKHFGRSGQSPVNKESSRGSSPDTWRASQPASASGSRLPSPTSRDRLRSSTDASCPTPKERQRSCTVEGLSSSTNSPLPTDETLVGFVHSYFSDCGFIKQDKKKSTKTVYFSSRNIVEGISLKAGDRVEYKVRYDKKSHEPCAYSVKKIDRIIDVPSADLSIKQDMRLGTQRVQAKGPDGSKGFGAGRGKPAEKKCFTVQGQIFSHSTGLHGLENPLFNVQIKT